jgi:hypothetical protein
MGLRLSGLGGGGGILGAACCIAGNSGSEPHRLDDAFGVFLSIADGAALQQRTHAMRT